MDAQITVAAGPHRQLGMGRCCPFAPQSNTWSEPSPTSHARAAACDESAPVAKLGDNERTDRLLAAEQAVLEAGGCVARLVGLYHAQR